MSESQGASMDAQAAFNEYDVAERIIRNKMEIARLSDENAELTRFFRQDDTGTSTLSRDGRPNIVVKVMGNSRIDDTLAKKVLDEATYTGLSKRVIDSAKARAMLDGDTLAQITKTFDNKISIDLE
jgi:hypothetical protein